MHRMNSSYVNFYVNGMFTLDVCVCINVQHCINVKRQEWVQTHSVRLCLRFY